MSTVGYGIIDKRGDAYGENKAKVDNFGGCQVRNTCYGNLAKLSLPLVAQKPGMCNKKYIQLLILQVRLKVLPIDTPTPQSSVCSSKRRDVKSLFDVIFLHSVNTLR